MTRQTWGTAARFQGNSSGRKSNLCMGEFDQSGEVRDPDIMKIVRGRRYLALMAQWGDDDISDPTMRRPLPVRAPRGV